MKTDYASEPVEWGLRFNFFKELLKILLHVEEVCANRNQISSLGSLLTDRLQYTVGTRRCFLQF